MAGRGISRMRGGLDEVKAIAMTPPAAAKSAGTVTGPAVNRLGYQSVALFAVKGAETGAPSARTLTVTIEDSADGSTGWAAYKPDLLVQVSGELVAAAATPVNADLTGAREWIRAIEVLAFTGGTAPTLLVSTVGVFTGRER
jgi:hypothetical protein